MERGIGEKIGNIDDKMGDKILRTRGRKLSRRGRGGKLRKRKETANFRTRR